MALKPNVFTSDFVSLNDQLKRLASYQHFVGWQLKQANASIVRSLELFDKKGWERDKYFAARGLSLLNVFHDGEYVIRPPAGATIIRGEELLEMSDEMNRKFNAFMLVHCFEDFEQFLVKDFGKFLFQIRSAGTIKLKRGFHKAFPQSVKHRGTPQYFREYAKWACNKNATPALDLFAKELNFSRLTILFYQMSFADFITALGFCRHCIVHNHGRLFDSSFEKLNKDKRELVSLFLHNGPHSNEVMVLPSTEMIDETFESLVSYGWALYILLAERCGMRDETQFFRDESGKRKVNPK